MTNPLGIDEGNLKTLSARMKHKNDILLYVYLYKRNDEIYESLKEETNNMLLLCSEAERKKIFSAIGYLTEYNDSPNTPIGKDLTRSIENYIQHCINTVPESITPLLELNPFGQ